MKWILIAVSVCALCGGGVSARYNLETKEVSYQRFGDQKLSGILVETKPNGEVSLIIESQQSEARLLTDAIKLIEKGIEIGAR